MGFPRQEYWSEFPFPPPGALPHPGIEPASPALQADSLPAEPLGKPSIHLSIYLSTFFFLVQTLFWEYSGGQNSLNFFSYGSYFLVQETNINKQITLLDNHRLKPPTLARHDDNHLGELSHNRRSQWETWYCHLKTNQENLGGAKRGRRQTSDIGLVLNSMEKIKWSRGQWGFPWGPTGKEAACQCRRCGFDPWVRKTPWRRTWQSIPLFLPGKSHGQRRMVGYSLWGCKETGLKRL